MFLADGGITFVWIGGVLLIGFVGFFVVVLAALARAVRFVFAPVLRLLRGGERQPEALPGQARPPVQRLCENPRCGHLNPCDARYCARCGHSLGAAVDIDSHG